MTGALLLSLASFGAESEPKNGQATGSTYPGEIKYVRPTGGGLDGC